MCLNKNKLFYLIILLINVKCYDTFNVNFYYNYNLQADPFNTEIHKRELQQSVDEGSYSFVGFEKVDNVPVLFPSDLCVLHVDGLKYATSLHSGKKGERHFVVFKMINESYQQIADIRKDNAISMDCVTFDNKGYVAIVLNLTKTILYAEDAAPIYEIAGDHIRAVQYFTTPNMLSMYLYVSGNDLFLLQTFSKLESCTYFKWSGSSFSELGSLHCSNVRHVELFSMDYELYVALANYADQNGHTNTYSEIFKFSNETQQFQLFQKIETQGASDVKYFTASLEPKIETNFLLFSNSVKENNNHTIDSWEDENHCVIYVFYNDQFLPYQIIPFYGFKKFLPLQIVEDPISFLLVAYNHETIKVYYLDGGQFKESPVQFGGEAFGHGISKIRVYKETRKNYLIIADELMMNREPNIFSPIFKQNDRIQNLRRQIVHWADGESKRLQLIDVKDLSSSVQKKLKLLEESGYKSKREKSTSYINTVTTKSFLYPKMKMSTNYWKALYYINQALDILEEQFNEKQRLKRQINTGEQYDSIEYIYDSLNINTLTVNQNIEAKIVNNIDAITPEFMEIHAPRISIKDTYTKPTRERAYFMENLDNLQESEVMHIRNLQINGKLNEYTWNDLSNNTLKRKAEIQFMKAPIKIQNLETPRTEVTTNEVNGQHLDTLVPIDGGKYVINQDIQFAAPVSAKFVQINERLNNVHVYKGKFDVLLKRANKTQIIEGPKNLSNVKVMEPITIAGQMLGKQLESITPNKAIHAPLTLQGDFMINGDVDINHRLQTADIIDLREKISLKQTLNRGIRLDKQVEDVKFKFLQPLKVNNSLVSFVNQNDLQKLVKLNQDEIQIIEGEKTFTDSLEIRRGFSEVKNLNGVDIEKLEKNSFLRNTNQTIKVPMKFGKIQAKGVDSSSILLNNRNITDYLTKSGNQTIKGNLIVDNLKANTLKVENLNTNSKIFQQNLQDIYHQKSRNAPQQDVFVKNQKFHGSIYVQNLLLNSTINGRRVEEIERNLMQMEGNIKYVGNFKFNYPMNVTQLTFYGKLNDVYAKDLGKCWLQKKGQEQQEFFGPQSLASVNAENGIHFRGKLNGFTMNDFYGKTFWINRDEYISDAVFENPIDISYSLTTQTLNNHYIPEEILSHKDSQEFFQPLTVEGSLEVQGNELNVTLMNDIDMHALRDYLKGGYSHCLCVENAYFSQGPPSYETLNYHNIAHTLDTVWLSNENVILPQHIAINEVYFEGLLEFEGLVNNVDVEFLKENYFSKTKSQNISVEMIFSDVVCDNDLEVNDVRLFGPIKEQMSETSFDFTQFVESTLKIAGPHVISGNWSILEAIIDGNLNEVLINNLNLVNDIVHIVKNLQPYELRAPKKFQDISIADLRAHPLSFLNNVPVDNWIKDAVYLYENYTIVGATTVESLNIFNDLSVLGTLNNITFNEYSLFLQDRKQNLPGNLRIVSHLMDERRFLTNNIENLYADFVNSEYIPRLMENLIAFTRNVEIQSHVIFREPVKVEKYQGPEGFLSQERWLKRALQQRTDAEELETALQNTHAFQFIEDYLRNIIIDNLYAIDHLEIRQTIKAYTSQVLTLRFKMSTGLVDVMALYDNVTNQVTFYKWSPEMRQFIESQDFNWLPSNMPILNIIHKMSIQSDVPPDSEYLKKFIHTLNQIQQIPIKSLDVEFLNENCFIIYKSTKNSPIFQINCVDLEMQQVNSELTARATSNIQQVLSLDLTSLALITNNSLEIWNITSRKLEMSQKFSVFNAKQLVLIHSTNNRRFLAVVTENAPKSLNQGSIEIFRSLHATRFELWQTLPCSLPIKLHYSYIPQSDDLLLYILTNTVDNPLIVYQYQGVTGFKQLLTKSILSASGLNLKTLDIKSSNHHMIGLVGSDEVSIVEIVLTKI